MSRSGHDFSSSVTFGGQCRFVGRATSIKNACFVVPPLFRADSGTNLIKQGGGATKWLGSSVGRVLAR